MITMVQPVSPHRHRSGRPHERDCKGQSSHYGLPLLVVASVITYVVNTPSDQEALWLLMEQMSSISTSQQSNSKSYSMAAHDSLGFFQDIPDEDWLRRKRLTNDAEHHLFSRRMNPAKPMKTPAGWYQNNWNEDFSCFAEVAVGRMGEGHKYVCDPHRLPSDCLVYSIGSNGNFKFEQHLQQLAPQCGKC